MASFAQSCGQARRITSNRRMSRAGVQGQKTRAIGFMRAPPISLDADVRSLSSLRFAQQPLHILTSVTIRRTLGRPMIYELSKRQLSGINESGRVLRVVLPAPPELPDDLRRWASGRLPSVAGLISSTKAINVIVQPRQRKRNRSDDHSRKTRPNGNRLSRRISLGPSEVQASHLCRSDG